MSSGIIVDELVSLIKYEMPASSKQALADADKASKKATGDANVMSKAFKGASGATGMLTGLIKDLGIASGVTSGILAAWSINAGKEANRLTNLSQATQVNIRDIQQLGSVYEQVGGDAKNFAADATAFFNTYGKKLNVEAMKEVAKTFSTLAPDMAQHLGKAYGFSDDMIRVLMKGPDAIQAMTDKAQQLGHVVKEEDIAALNSMNSSWNDLKGTISATSLVFQSGMADGMKRTFDNISQMIAANQSEFQKWGAGIGLLMEEVAARVLGQKSQLQKDWEEIRKQERQHAENKAQALKEESASLPDVEAVGKTVTKIEKAKADIPELKSNNIWDTLVESMLIYSQRTLSDSWNRLTQGYDRHNALNDTENTLDEARATAIHGSSPEEKRWMALHSPDIGTRRELMDLGWVSEEVMAAIKAETSKIGRNLASLRGQDKDVDEILDRLDLSPNQKREMIAAKRVVERDFVGSAASPSQTSNNGDYTNNSGNISNAQTVNYVSAPIQISNPDPVAAGNEAANALNALFPSHDGNQYGTW